MAIAASMMGDCCVYWLFDDHCICLWRHGYIGVTINLTRRLAGHRRGNGRGTKLLPENFQFEILFTGTSAQCFELEQHLRPVPMIGWNRARGGPRAPDEILKGIPKSLEHKARIAAASKLRWSDLAARKIQSATVKKSLASIDRSGANNTNFGKATSEAAKQKMRDKIIERGGIVNPVPKGSHRTDAEKATISAAVRSAGPLTPEQRERQLANTQRGEAHWRRNRS